MTVYLLLGLLFLTSCATQPKPEPGPEKISLSAVSFGDLPGWNDDRLAEALPAFARSCAVLQKKADWISVCAAAAAVPANDNAAARKFFETHFTPYAASGNEGDEGLFTGYYEPELQGSLQQAGEFQTPLYAHPTDLVDVDLGDFKPSLKGQHVAGKVIEAKAGHPALKPYDTRGDIARGSLKGRAQVLAYVSDPVDAFFLAVQGSGRIRLTDGSVMRLGYDGSNGRAYTSIGRAMSDENLIEKPVTMPSIKAWLAAHPDRAEDVMEKDQSYIFFRPIEGDGPVGAETVALTPTRSMAVDPAFVTLGTPIWLDTKDGTGADLRRLVIAQDTGGAIKGPVRGDFFWGSGDEAGVQAGAMQSKGRYFLLMPKGVHVAFR